MKITVLNIIVLVGLVFFSCQISVDDPCNLLPYSRKISSSVIDDIKVKQKIEPNIDLNIFFQPYIIPFKLICNINGEISVEATSELTLPVVIGEVGIGFSTEIKLNTYINNVQITPTDYLISIIDKKRKSKKLYKIEKTKKLYATLVGGNSVIRATPGLVEIDITNTEYQEIIFIDMSKYKIINSTVQNQNYRLEFEYDFNYVVSTPVYDNFSDSSPKLLHYTFQNYVYQNSIPVDCVIPPLSYIIISGKEFKNVLGNYAPSPAGFYSYDATKTTSKLFITSNGIYNELSTGSECIIYSNEENPVNISINTF